MIKFDIWGNGIRGQELFYKFDRECIGEIIDSSHNVQGTMFEGKEIISPEEYLKKQTHNVLIITPEKYEDDIQKMLLKKGKKGVFKYNKFFSPIECFLNQVDREKILAELDKSNQIVLYGINIFTIIVYDFLTQNNYNCVVCKDLNAQIEHIDYLKKSLQFNIVEDICYLEQNHKNIFMLCCELKNEENMLLRRYTCIDLFNMQYNKDYFYTSSLIKYKDCHKGERCFIVATGPSLSVDDLNKLELNKEISFGINSIFKTYEKMGWRPTYYVVTDPKVAKKAQTYLNQVDGTQKIIADIDFDNKIREQMPVTTIHLLRKKADEFSVDLEHGLYVSGTVVVDACIPIAIYMGFKEIYLLGTDCNYTLGGLNNHFGGDEKPDLVNHNINGLFQAYKKAKQVAELHGVRIYNATRGGKLEEFERVDFDTLFTCDSK